MNTKIFALIKENLELAFNLPKYANIRESIIESTEVDALPWTPARYRKFKDAVEAKLAMEDCNFTGTLLSIVDKLDKRYTGRFFGEIWKPRTGDYDYTGWALAESIQKQNPQAVLDVGCGYCNFNCG